MGLGPSPALIPPGLTRRTFSVAEFSKPHKRAGVERAADHRPGVTGHAAGFRPPGLAIGHRFSGSPADSASHHHDIRLLEPSAPRSNPSARTGLQRAGIPRASPWSSTSTSSASRVPGKR